MQTILGAGGAIGTGLAKDLTQYTDAIRLVSRNPVKVNPSDELMAADLTHKDAVRRAVQGSSVVYVTVGFPYKLKVWRKVWPPFIGHVIEACKEHNARLVFFDNIYMYDANHLNGMTEETPVHPPSQKGVVRAEVVRMIMDEVQKGELTALIARSADFYGPGIKETSLLTELVLHPLSRGKKASWLGPVHFKHSFTYTPDAAKATALLGNTEDAYNQVWHLPTAANPPTGKEWIEAIAREMDVKPRYRSLSKRMVQLAGWFVPPMSEIPEMMYQNDRHYVFDSSKFEERFDFTPTPYAEGIKEIIEADYKDE